MQEGSCKSRRPPFQDTSFFRPNRLSSPHDLIVSDLQHDVMVANFRMKVNFPLRSMNSESKERELLFQSVREFFIFPPSALSQLALLTLTVFFVTFAL